MARRKKSEKKQEVIEEVKTEVIPDVTESKKDSVTEEEIVIGSRVRLNGKGRKSFDIDSGDSFKDVPGIVKTILTTKEFGYGILVEPVQEILWFKREEIEFFK